MNKEVWNKAIKDTMQTVNKWVEEQNPRPSPQEVAGYAKAFFESQAEPDWPSLSVLIVDKETSLVRALGKYSE